MLNEINFSIYSSITFLDLISSLFYASVIVLIFYCPYLIIRIVFINKKIETFCSKRDAEIESSKTSSMTIAGFEALRKSIEDRYEKLIVPLRRKKSYILDILLFVRK